MELALGVYMPRLLLVPAMNATPVTPHFATGMAPARAAATSHEPLNWKSHTTQPAQHTL